MCYVSIEELNINKLNNDVEWKQEPREDRGEENKKKNRMRERKVWQGKNKKGEREEEDTSYWTQHDKILSQSDSKAGASWAQEWRHERTFSPFSS